MTRTNIYIYIETRHEFRCYPTIYTTIAIVDAKIGWITAFQAKEEKGKKKGGAIILRNGSETFIIYGSLTQDEKGEGRILIRYYPRVTILIDSTFNNIPN